MFSRLVTRKAGVRAYSTSAFRASSSLTNNKNKFEFNWADRVQGATPKLVSNYKAASIHIADLKAQATTDLKVPTIDWAYWEKEISSPGVVSALRAEYEALKFDAAGVSEEDIKAKNQAYDAQIASAEKRVTRATQRTADAQAKLAKFQKYYDNVENYGMTEFYELIPGIEEELRQQYWDGHYTLDDGERKNAAYDPHPAVEYLAHGGAVGELPNALLAPSTPAKLGDFDVAAEWKKREQEDLADTPGTAPIADNSIPKFREPKTHHDLLPILAQRKAGAPVFGAPLPGEPEGHH